MIAPATNPPRPGITKRSKGGSSAKLSAIPGAELPVSKLWTALVAKRNAIEQTPPQNPMMPAQNTVTWRSLGCARSLNHTQNFSRRRDLRRESLASGVVLFACTLTNCVRYGRRQERFCDASFIHFQSGAKR